MLAKWSRPWLFSAVSLFAATSVLASPHGSPAEADAQEAARPAADAGKPETGQPEVPVARRSPRPGDVTKVFVLQHGSARVLADVLQVFPATISRANQTIGVSAAPGVMAAIEETIKRLDVAPPPARSVELIGYVLEALPQRADSPVPAELESVVAQLKNTFSHAGYRLLDTLIARGLEGSSLHVSTVGAGPEEMRNVYDLRTHALRVLAGPTVRLDGVFFQASIPFPRANTVPMPRREAWVRGDVEIRSGQKVVIGRSGTSDGEKAIILVLGAKLVD